VDETAPRIRLVAGLGNPGAEYERTRHNVGFAVVDFAARKEIQRITLPDVPGQEREKQGLQGSPSHGLAITPDGKWPKASRSDDGVSFSGVFTGLHSHRGGFWYP